MRWRRARSPSAPSPRAAIRASSLTRNIPTNGRVPNGATIERELRFDISAPERTAPCVAQSGFHHASRIAGAINAFLGVEAAIASDLATVRLRRPADLPRHVATHRADRGAGDRARTARPRRHQRNDRRDRDGRECPRLEGRDRTGQPHHPGSGDARRRHAELLHQRPAVSSCRRAISRWPRIRRSWPSSAAMACR